VLERNRREVPKNSRFLRQITISKELYRLQKSTAESLTGGGRRRAMR
jgi:hypothetical protein